MRSDAPPSHSAAHPDIRTGSRAPVGLLPGALCGSPWGTTVYIGHTTYKKFGATRGYSALCGAARQRRLSNHTSKAACQPPPPTTTGIFFLVFGLSGLYGILDSLIPHDIYVGILACIGMLIAGQCVEVTPKRWCARTHAPVLRKGDSLRHLITLRPSACGHHWSPPLPQRCPMPLRLGTQQS